MRESETGAFQIVDEAGTVVEVCVPEMVELALSLYNARRELDVDGNPLGEYVAVPCKKPSGWGA